MRTPRLNPRPAAVDRAKIWSKSDACAGRPANVGLIQPDTLTVAGARAVLVGSWTYPVPSNRNAWPARPVVYVAPPTSVPWFPSTTSRAARSAFHHDTSPLGRVLPFNSTPSPALP